MAAVIIRDLPAETHRALKLRAKKKGLSTEAEIRSILQEVVEPVGRIRIGSELAAFGRKYGGLQLKIERDKTPATGADFE